MRDSFRRERKVRKREEEATEAMKERLGTDIDLLPENEEDTRRAKLIDFGEKEVDGAATNVQAMFKPPKSARSVSRLSKTAKENRADALRRQLLGNTRAAMNPF